MGTLSILPPTVVFSLTPSTRSPDGSAQGWWNPTTLGSTDADILSGLTTGLVFVCTGAPAVTSAILVFKWDVDTPVFSLDGGPLLSFTDLPDGLLINGTITLLAEWNNGPSGPYSANFRDSTINQGVAVAFLFNDLFTPGLPLIETDPNIFIGKSEFILESFTLSLAGTSLAIPTLISIATSGVGPFTLTGLFSTFSQSWTIFLPEGEPARAGDRVHIISPEDSDNDFTDVHEINFTLGTRTLTITQDGTFTITDGDEVVLLQPGSPWVITWTLTLIIIVIPYGFGDDEGDVEVEPRVAPQQPFPPTQFSGTVSIGTFELEFADVSGIYNITLNKTNDTLYDRDGTTVDVAIPRPSAKTGFIGG